MLYENHIFQHMGKIFCVEFQRVPFEIPHKLSYPHIERCWFYSQVKIEELLDLKAHKCFWNVPLVRTLIVIMTTDRWQ